MSAAWLREVPATLENQVKATRAANALSQYWGRSELPRCPGCRCRKGLKYLLFANDAHPDDTFKNHAVLAVCPASFDRLMELKKSGEVFGISGLVHQVGWICLKKVRRASIAV